MTNDPVAREVPDRLTVDQTFTWTSFEMTAPVEIPSNPGGAYITELSAELDDRDVDDEGTQTWSLTIKIPNDVGPNSTMATIARTITVPGWREAVDQAQDVLVDIAAKAAVAAEARRLFNHAVRRWGSPALGDLDLAEAVDGLLEAIDHAYSRRYRLKADPFHDTAADVDSGQGVN